MEPDHLARIRANHTELFTSIRDDKMWGEIRRMALTDPGMANLLEQVVVYYRLKKG